MRALPLLALLAFVPPTSVAAQGMVVPVRCPGDCRISDERPWDRIDIDSVDVWANLDGETAVTYVWHVIRNRSPTDLVDAAFFFPLPAGATIERVMVHDNGQLELYGEWTGPEETRRIVQEILRERPASQVQAYARVGLVHVRIPSLPAGGTRRLQIAYRQLLRREGGALAYRYPLGQVAGSSPVGELTLGLTVTTRAGFAELRSPSHPVHVTWGTEMGRCPPQARCGFRSVPSRRVKVVRMERTPDARAHDFVLVFTPAAAGQANAETMP